MWESRKSPGLLIRKPDPQDRAFGVIVERMFADAPFLRACITVTTDASRGSVFRPQMLDISYSYVAGGERYAAFESLSFRRLDTAEAYAAGLRDADISVRYNPRSPQEATIDFPPGIPR